MSTIQPIILGGDIGAYALARAFHEAYRVRSTVITGIRTGPVADSGIIDLRLLGQGDDPARLIRAVLDVAAERPAARSIVLASADWLVAAITDHRQDLLAADICVPYPEAELIRRVSDKAEFSRICDELEIPQPTTWISRATDPIPESIPLPCVVKAASSSDFHRLQLPGKNKVEFFSSREQVHHYFRRVHAADYRGEFVLQERIDGGDEAMAAVNAGYGPDRRGHMVLFGQVLLEEHTPNGRGNSVAQVTGGARAHDAAVADAQRLLTALGWSGFANIDLKRDSDGRCRFLEINPRVGRSGYAVTAAGYNVARWYVEAFLEEQPAPDEPVIGTTEHLFVVVPIRLLRRYVPAHLRGTIRRLQRRGAVTNPYYYRREHHPRRWAYIVMAMVNQFRKFRRFHPHRSS